MDNEIIGAKRVVQFFTISFKDATKVRRTLGVPDSGDSKENSASVASEHVDTRVTKVAGRHRG